MVSQLLLTETSWVAIISAAIGAVVGAVATEISHYLYDKVINRNKNELSMFEKIIIKTAARFKGEIYIFYSGDVQPWIRIGAKDFDDSPEFQRNCVDSIKQLIAKDLVYEESKSFLTLTAKGFDEAKKIPATFVKQ